MTAVSVMMLLPDFLLFHGAIGYVEACNQHIQLFLDFSDILRIKSGHAISASKEDFASFIFEYSGTGKLISLQTIPGIVINEFLFLRVQFGDSLMSADPYIAFSSSASPQIMSLGSPSAVVKCTGIRSFLFIQTNPSEVPAQISPFVLSRRL